MFLLALLAAVAPFVMLGVARSQEADMPTWVFLAAGGAGLALAVPWAIGLFSRDSVVRDWVAGC